eukprot:CAMPEP_0197005646 /NCGR_PEP_ID=MMETSP1380-20130617/30501_1 /TAXON_ID=5936 /ORGANISM="Euplotes crassus, Strain CT5" /LENGTH=316 /DNA_ID=CAMNT_0042424853 /DNA_START=77 /DNA_END=1027 /DNA_ORIENTATION=+
MKVLGIEQFPTPGSLGSSSFGETRMWRVTHGSYWKNDMMKDAITLWRELEEESGEELMLKFPVLSMGSLESKDYMNIRSQYPELPKLSPKEISEKYPALHNIPDDYEGLEHENCGVVKARKALQTVTKLTQVKYGAELLFDTKVVSVDKNSVTIEDGRTFYGKDICVCAGAYSIDFDKDKIATRREIEYIVFESPEGLPGGLLEFTKDGNEYYGMVDGDNFKMGEFAQRSISSMKDYFRDRMPEKFTQIKYFHPCYITMTDTGHFQYKTGKDGVHYAYGFEGTGFKFFPLHGKIVHDGLITKKDQTHIPDEYRAKI